MDPRLVGESLATMSQRVTAPLVSDSIYCPRVFFFFQAEDGIRDVAVTGVQTCALPICDRPDPQEVVGRLDSRVRVGPIAKGANVRMRGEDIHAGTIVVERGTVLRPQEIDRKSVV